MAPTSVGRRISISLDAFESGGHTRIGSTFVTLELARAYAHEVIPKARQAALRALELDDTVAEAHASLGLIKAQYDWDRPGAERDLKRAIELDPNYAIAHHALGGFYYSDAQFEQASAHFERARALDPLSLMIGASAIWPLPYLGRTAEALDRLLHLSQLHPNVSAIAGFLHDSRAEFYVEQGKNDAALAECLQGFVLAGGDPAALAALKRAYASAGFAGYWRKQLELADAKYQTDMMQAQKEFSPRYIGVFDLARLHARVGDIEGSFA